ncbi:hypothetical protein [Hyphomicrobium sp.]|jgi:hypothetical protein|uniref:hypothetical protein n=1 Tax=Hyphomicrobium sp. TaxID=82 RepID=UPI002FDE9EAD
MVVTSKKHGPAGQTYDRCFRLGRLSNMAEHAEIIANGWRAARLLFAKVHINRR